MNEDTLTSSSNNSNNVSSLDPNIDAIMISSIHILPCFRDLIAVLVECFTIISLGYLSCRFKLISPQAKDMSAYLTTFALPMIIFLNIAQMEFSTINLSFLFCMFTAKFCMFLMVTILTLAISYPTNFAYAGALSILATQSNDFALGYPLIKSLYGESKPEMLGYLSLMAPIQLLILNPLGITLLEFHKSRSQKKNEIQTSNCSCSSLTTTQQVPSSNANVINWNFLKSLASNPLIIASVVALLVNLTRGPELPKVFTKTANTIAASFAAPALFVVGLSMYGKFELLLRNPRDLMLASALVLTKEIILPNIMRTLALTVLPKFVDSSELPFLVDFSYLYGLLPTAPTACIIANQYGVLSNVVSISMLLSTFTSAPLILTASAIITQSPAADIVQSFLTETVKFSSLFSMTLASLTLYAIWRYEHKPAFLGSLTLNTNIVKDPARIFLPLLTGAQMIIGIGGLIWYFVDTSRLDIAGSSEDIHPDHNPGSSHELSSLSNIDNGHSMFNTNQQMVDRDLMDPILMVPVSIDLKLCTICTVHYVFSSAGIILARFIVLSIIITIFVRRFKHHEAANKVSTYLVFINVILAVITVIWLIIDSDDLRCTPTEPSLPSKTKSLVVRLIFNVIFLAISIPLFALMFRLENRSLKKKSAKATMTIKKDSPVSKDLDDSIVVMRQFINSNASLSSETGSNLTSNTNLDLSSSMGLTQTKSQVLLTQNHQHDQWVAGSLPTNLAVKTFDTMSQLEKSVSIGNQEASLERPTTSQQEIMIEPYETSTNIKFDTNQHDFADVVDGYTDRESCSERSIQTSTTISTMAVNMPIHATQFIHQQLHSVRFNKYSILIVFMLIDSTLNLTSICQVLSQDKPFGTFRQIEFMGVLLDFGQGLLTFLVYGASQLLNHKR